MKLESVALRNYGSHVDTRWDPEDADRLCVITGPNGAGKTTLVVDSLLHALYDGAAGGVDDVVRLGETDSAAVIEFTLDGSRYRATRRRTTKAGGRTSADLAVQGPDGSWTPLASGAKDVPAAVEALLRMDEATFRTAVVLAQREADRFLVAPAGKGTATEPGRAAILSSIIVPPEFVPAESAARERALELAQDQRSQRARAEQLGDALEELRPVPEAFALRQSDVRVLEAEITAANAIREVMDKRLQELAAELAAGEAAEADVTRLVREIEDLKTRYRRAQERQASARRMAEMAAQTLAGAAAVEEAAARIPELESLVAEREKREAEAIALDERIQVAREEHRLATFAAENEHAQWKTLYEETRRQVDELAGAVQQLQPVTCPKCSESIVIDQADLQGKLTLARRKFKALESMQPKASTSAAREAAAIARLESRRRELGDVRAPLAEARGELSRMQSQAARAEAIATARQTAHQAAADDQTATDELVEISAAGQAARASLTDAQAIVAGLQGFRAERSNVTEQLLDATKRLPELARSHSEAIANVGRLGALVERLEAFRAERAALTTAAAATALEAGRVKRLVAAFGVTGIPARYIDTALPELTDRANELLGQLRPGTSVEVRGQRATKDGKKVVDAIHIAVRDELGERVLDRWSGGERTSIALALAHALSALSARRAGSAIRTRLIDEPDGLDIPARRAFGQAMRVLAHRGDLDRIVVITHTPEIVEYADRVDQVSKNGHGSVVERVA